MSGVPVLCGGRAEGEGAPGGGALPPLAAGVPRPQVVQFHQLGPWAWARARGLGAEAASEQLRRGWEEPAGEATCSGLSAVGLLTADSDPGAHLHVIHFKSDRTGIQEHLIPFASRTSPDLPSALATVPSLSDLEVFPLYRALFSHAHMVAVNLSWKKNTQKVHFLSENTEVSFNFKLNTQSTSLTPAK